MKSLLLNILSQRFGLALVKTGVRGHRKFLLYEDDAVFQSRYEEGLRRSGTPDGGAKRYERFYNLIQWLKYVQGLSGGVVECGVWRGLSSFLICHYLNDATPGFNGQDFHIFDSFEGLSEPEPIDVDPRAIRADWPSQPKQGAYSAQIDVVRNTLGEFPAVSFNKGWIPAVFAGQPVRSYRFVHIDVDLHSPVAASLEFFLPQLVEGGVLVVDDFGSLHWPGAKAAVEEFSVRHAIPFVGLSSGQAVIIKR